MSKLIFVVLVFAVVAFAEELLVKPQLLSDADMKMLRDFSAPRKEFTEAELADVPDTFDAREQWSSCKQIGKIYNIKHTSSASILSGFGAIDDRACIADANHKLELSVLDAELCSNCLNTPICIWNYWASTGLVTRNCYPFNKEGRQCAHKCTGNPSIDWDNDKHKGKAYSLSGEDNMKADLVKNGPFQVSFAVYADFYSYKSGIYSHKSGGYEGGHSVKLLGYGQENGVKYWLCANSLGESWGEKGFFKIVRGTNECGIEGKAIAGNPQ